MEETFPNQNNLNNSKQEQIQTTLPSPNSNNKITGKLNKSRLRKLFKIFILLIFFVLIGTLYSFNRFIYPVITFLPQSLKPWSKTEGKVCDFGGCRTSEVNQIYNYWLSEALKNKNATLCNNTVGLDGGDTGISSKEYSINQCKVDYSIKAGDLEVCKSLSAENMTRCLPGIAEASSKPEIFNNEDCLRVLNDQNLFADCALRLAKIKKTDRECDILSDRRMWFKDQMCRQYSAVVEPRTDNSRIEVTVSNFRQYITKCNNYTFLYNRATCFTDIIEALSFKESQPKVIENYCVDNILDNSWNVCWFFESFSGSRNSIYTRTDEIKSKGLSAAISNPTFKNSLCESLRWNTWGSKAILDNSLKDFAINKCDLDYFSKF